MRQRADCQKFQNTFLDFFQSIVLLFQDFFCIFHILTVFRSLIPRHLQHRLDISTDHAVFCRTVQRSRKTRDLLFDLFFYFFRCVQILQTLPKFIGVISGRLLSEFFPDHFHLFPQNIFSLMLVYPLFDFQTDLIFDIHDLCLIDKFQCEQFISLPKIQLIQKFLLICIIQW